ncbi:endolytic transglycosylase MltG [bacterium]|nr:endolytic transglycosylase MltG [bacterium]
MKPVNIIIAIAIGIILGIAGFAFIYLNGESAHPDREGDVLITIPQGASAYSVGYTMRDSTLINDVRRFIWHLKFRGMTSDLQAGTFRLPRSASMKEMANILAYGEEARVLVTIPEGWSSMLIAGELQRQGVCDSVEFMAAVLDTNTIAKAGFGKHGAEGFLFPESYSLPYTHPAEKVVAQMLETFTAKTGTEWLSEAKIDRLGLHGIVTLASIIQGEMQLNEEGGDISAVYRNRLKQNMKLQADPTIQYIVKGAPRRLLLSDLKIDSPYNTYKYKGLPPGPINNPGLVALKAAINPAEKNWIFMVARGDGGHTFTTNWQDHLKAKERLDAIRRQVARNEQNQG